MSFSLEFQGMPFVDKQLRKPFNAVIYRCIHMKSCGKWICVHTFSLSAAYWWSLACTHRILPHPLCFVLLCCLFEAWKNAFCRAPSPQKTLNCLESISYRDELWGNACVQRWSDEKKKRGCVMKGSRQTLRKWFRTGLMRLSGCKRDLEPMRCRQHQRAGWGSLWRRNAAQR